MKKSYFFSFLLVISFANTGFAFHSGAFGIQSAAAANKVISSNPPLPMLYYQKGKYKISFQPSYFVGKRDNSALPIQSGEFRGWGLGAQGSYSFYERWGIYLWTIGDMLSGDFRNDPFQFLTEIKGVKASFITASGGIIYQLLGRTDGGFSFPIFFGPTYSRAKFSQTIFETDKANGSTRADFDMEAEHQQVGFLAGAQAGINLGRYFLLNPFFISTFGFGDECQPYEVTQLRTGGTGLEEQSTPDCERKDPKTNFPTTKKLVDFPKNALVLGANLTFKPWGLSFNVTAPFLRKSLGKEENTVITIFTLSYSFGNYIKGTEKETELASSPPETEQTLGQEETGTQTAEREQKTETVQPLLEEIPNPAPGEKVWVSFQDIKGRSYSGELLEVTPEFLRFRERGRRYRAIRKFIRNIKTTPISSNE